MNIYEHMRKVGIQSSPKFQEKQLATDGMNMGLSCGHLCRYCSSTKVLGRLAAFRDVTGKTAQEAFEAGDVIVDPETPLRVAAQAASLTPDRVVMMSTTTDPYSSEVKEREIGRKCAQAVLEKSPALLRILTKNASVMDDFDLFAKHKDRVLFGMSVTGPARKEHLVSVLEPHASKISERLEAYRKSKEVGLPTYGMLCPCVPGIATSREDIRDMLEAILEVDPTDIWLEPLNDRGKRISLCVEAMLSAGHRKEASLIEQLLDKEMHNLYVEDLVDTATEVARELGCFEKLKILVYGNPRSFSCDDSAVIWL